LVDSVQRYVSYSTLRDGFRRNFDAWHTLSNVSSYHPVFSHDLIVGNSGDTEGKIEAKGQKVRRRKQLLAEFKETKGYWKLKEEKLDRALWRTRFGRGSGAVVRQTKL